MTIREVADAVKGKLPENATGGQDDRIEERHRSGQAADVRKRAHDRFPEQRSDAERQQLCGVRLREVTEQSLHALRPALFPPGLGCFLG
jgi:hypothetical protein